MKRFLYEVVFIFALLLQVAVERDARLYITANPLDWRWYRWQYKYQRQRNR